MERVEVVGRPAERSPASGEFGRRKIFETENVRIGQTRVGPGAASAWHHHGKRTLYGYIVSGQLTVEFGPGGSESVRASAGEFLRIPPGLVHRDVNSTSVSAIVVNVTIGEGPATIDVSGPET